MKSPKKSKSTIKQKKTKSRKGAHGHNDQTDYEQMEVDDKFVSLESSFAKRLDAGLKALNEGNFRISDIEPTGQPDKDSAAAARAYRDIATGLQGLTTEIRRVAENHSSLATEQIDLEGYAVQIESMIESLERAAADKYQEQNDTGRRRPGVPHVPRGGFQGDVAHYKIPAVYQLHELPTKFQSLSMRSCRVWCRLYTYKFGVKRLASFLREMGVVPLNPLKKPTWMPETCHMTIPERLGLAASEQITQKTCEDSLDFDREYCLRLVINCDFVIWAMNNNKTFGTTEELALAKQLHKPIVILQDEPITSTWMQSLVRGCRVEESIIGLKDWLKRLDKNGVESSHNHLDWTIPSYIAHGGTREEL